MKKSAKHGLYIGLYNGCSKSLLGSLVLRRTLKNELSIRGILLSKKIFRLMVPLPAVLLLGLFPLHITFADGKGNGVQVISVSPKLVDSQPGAIISASFQVTNKSAQDEEFIETLVLPQGWQAVIPPTSFVAHPNETVVRIVAFLAPIGTPSGKYQISYIVRSQKDYGIQDVGRTEVAILPVSRLALVLESKPNVVVAGDEYEIKARLINQGNDEVHAVIDAQTDERYPITLDPVEMTLPSGTNNLIKLKVKSSDKLKKTIRQSIRLRAQATGSKNIAVMANIVAVIDIYPIGQGSPAMYQEIASTIRMQVTGNGADNAFQTEIFGAGDIDQTHNRRVDYLIRTPDSQSSSFYGERDEYRFNYYSKHADVRLGDQTYSLSNLTSYFSYGRGAEVGYRNAQSAFGAYVVNSRWDSNRSDFGAYVSKHISDRTQLKFNFLNRTDSTNAENADIEDNICSLEAKTTLAQNTYASMEYALSNSTRNSGAGNSAYKLNVDGTRGDTYFTFGKIHADPDYFGYYNNADYTNGTMSFPIKGKFRGHLTAQRWTQNLDQAPLLNDAPLDNLYQAGVDFIPSTNMRYTLDCAYFRHQDLMPQSKYNQRERSVRFGFGRFFTNSSIQSYIDFGKQSDLLTGIDTSVNRYSIYYYLRASSRQYFTLFAQAGDSRPDASRLLGGSNTVGASGFWQTADNLSLSLQYSLNGFSQDRNSNNQLYFTAVYGNPGDRTFTLRVRQVTQQSIGAKSSYFLSYTIPFGIPIARKTNVSIINGRVYDAEKPGSPGIARAMLSANGITAVTDKNGEFTISSLPPGNYSVQIDKSSIGLDRTTKDITPLMVAVKGGETAGLQIPIVHASVFTGVVAMYSHQDKSGIRDIKGDIFLEGQGDRTLSGAGPKAEAAVASDDEMVENAGVCGVMLELASGNETLRTMTYSNGDFSFEDLRPGNWKLTVYDYNLPAYHYLEKSELNVALSPGEEKRTTLRVLPTLRQIKILEQGVVMSQNIVNNKLGDK